MSASGGSAGARAPAASGNDARRTPAGSAISATSPNPRSRFRQARWRRRLGSPRSRGNASQKKWKMPVVRRSDLSCNFNSLFRIRLRAAGLYRLVAFDRAGVFAFDTLAVLDHAFGNHDPIGLHPQRFARDGRNFGLDAGGPARPPQIVAR